MQRIAEIEQGRRKGCIEGRLMRSLDRIDPDQLLRIWNEMLFQAVQRYGPLARIVWSCEQRQWQYVILAQVY